MKRIALIVIALMALATNAFAVGLEFAFDVNSSSASIYPCDAGIKHSNHGDKVCYDRVTQNSCSPDVCVNQASCNCVCTGGIAGNGQEKLDMIQAKYADWSENGSYSQSGVTSVAVHADSNNFNRIFQWKNEWGKQLTSLSFNLGSERYGTEFYLDVCYRGPQIEYWQAYQTVNQTNGNGFPNFFIKLQATVTDIVSNNGLRYTNLADLKVKSTVICDVQGQGSFVYAHDNNGNYDNAYAHDLLDLNGGEKNFFNNYVSFNGGANINLLNDWINYGNANVPRFCKVRYSFIENRRNDGNAMSQIRKWQNQKAKICTYTDINEG